jgi:hypothetical protein
VPAFGSKTDAIIRVLSAVGGTTNPKPGAYGFGNLEVVTFTAIPNSGYKFSYWVVSGSYMPGHGGSPSLDTNVVTDNPLTVTCGYNYTWDYQPVFTPVEANVPPPGSQPFGLSSETIVALVVLLVVVVVVAVAVIGYMYMKRGKK